MVDKPLSFKRWLHVWISIDYDEVEDCITDRTKEIWHEGYSRYLQDWEYKNSPL